ncbi:MAG: DMT family transporter [Acidobacteriota bacterium]
MEKNQKKAYIFAVISVFFWSTVATVFKLTLRYTGYSELLLMSIFFSLIALSLIVTIEKKWELFLNLKKKDIVQSVFLGFLNPFLYYFLIFKAYSVLPAQIAQSLNQIWGVVIVLLSIPILKQKIGLISISGVLVSFFGVVILSTGGSFSFGDIREPLGISFALLSSIVWSLYWIFNTKSRRDPIISLTINFFAGFIFAVSYYALYENTGNFGLEAIGGSVYIGFFEMGITFFLWLKALRFSITTAKVSILIYLAPFLSLLFINYVLDEKILLSSFIGLLFIITGIIISRKDKKAAL